MADNKFSQFLSDHPRMIGVLFTMMVFLSSTGAAAASNVGVISGP
jgi:hypothetical protein